MQNLTSSAFKKILFVVAHSDDESLGAGGTLAKYSQLGTEIKGMYFTNGVSARAENESGKDLRKINADNVSTILGFKWIFQGDFPDNQLDKVPLLEIVKKIEEVKLEFNPDLIFTHSAADLNLDHRKIAEAVLTAFRPQPNETYTEILSMEIPSATDFGHINLYGYFAPNVYVNIEETWNLKMRSLQQYQDEMRPAPHSRSIEGIENLAKYRGFQVGLWMAEAFQSLRRIERN